MATALVAVPAAAKSTAPEGDGATLEEVVVTAQRREENLETVPVAVTVLTSTMIEQRGMLAQYNLSRLLERLTRGSHRASSLRG